MSRNKRYECKPYKPKEGEQPKPFLFVSYAHQDADIVKPIVDALDREGFRIWYDKLGEGIDPGKSWEEHIFERLGESSAFLSFVSQHNEFRPVVLQEMAAAVERHEADESYSTVFVCLEKVSTRSFQEILGGKKTGANKVSAFLNNNQFIDYKQYGGLTERFMNRLMTAGWPPEVIDNHWRSKVGKSILNPIPGKTDDVSSFIVDTNDFSMLARFERQRVRNGCRIDGKLLPMYRCSPNQISHHVAYPTSLDNQWVPEHIYGNEEFRKSGFLSKSAVSEIVDIQRREISRCLLNSWQMAVNRASMWNSRVFSEWYTKGSAEEDAFSDLLIEGTIIICLALERTPDAQPQFDYDSAAFEEWIGFLKRLSSKREKGTRRKGALTCLRLDWESDDSNRLEFNQLISVPFQDFCLTTASNRERLDSLCTALGIKGAERAPFQRCWAAVRDDVVAWSNSHIQRNKTSQRCYNRERFYQEFVIAERDSAGKRRNVKDGVLDWEDKPFADKLKRVIDFQYSMNLPLALQIHPVLPSDAPLQPYLIANNPAKQRRRELSVDELVYAFDQFEPSLDSPLPIPDSAHPINLSTTKKLRELPTWKEYVAAVTECMDRSRLDQIDFGDVYRVWDRYRKFLATAKERHPELNWQLQPSAALSVIARFEEHKIVVLYRPDTIGLSYWVGNVRVNDDPTQWHSNNRKSIPAELKRKVNLSISFVCADVTKENWDSSPFIAEHLMFDGMTHDEGFYAIKELVNRVKLKQSRIRDRGQE